MLRIIERYEPDGRRVEAGFRDDRTDARLVNSLNRAEYPTFTGGSVHADYEPGDEVELSIADQIAGIPSHDELELAGLHGFTAVDRIVIVGAAVFRDRDLGRRRRPVLSGGDVIADSKTHEVEWLLALVERSCEAKVAYPSAKTAYLALARPNNARRLKGCEPYRCRFCGEFHVGHSRATA